MSRECALNRWQYVNICSNTAVIITTSSDIEAWQLV